MSDYPKVEPARIRLFIGLPLAESVRNRLNKAVLDLKKDMKDLDIRWVPWRNYHITLVFLGSLTAGDIPIIETIMAETVRDMPAFKVEIKNIRGFPNPNKPKLLVAEVSVNESLRDLQKRLTATLIRAAYEVEDHKFRPHITVARLKKPVKFTLPPEQGQSPLNNPVDLIHLYQSDTQPGGAVYTILRTSALN